jgi:hypothetical protein
LRRRLFFSIELVLAIQILQRPFGLYLREPEVL